MRRLWALLPLVALLAGCDEAEIRHTAAAYYPDLSPDDLATQTAEMARVMPYYVVGVGLAIAVCATTLLNALERARQLGKDAAVRFGSYLSLLCFVGLFLAMQAKRPWLPAGWPLPAFGGAFLLSGVGCALVGRGDADRAVLRVGYVMAALLLPLIGLVLSDEVALVDTTASLFIGVAAGMLGTIVLSDPVRHGLVDFLTRRDRDDA
ncbi:MAG: hypothetical protein ACE366_17890 [Bradymonadia bacterium]